MIPHAEKALHVIVSIVVSYFQQHEVVLTLEAELLGFEFDGHCEEAV